ncbi:MULTISPECIES: DUF3313 family protein [Chromobacterium]|uniref:DUF3313 family protein n=1 Tax=Chromobacterium TaxID=535 RepID=UPI000D3265AC|nr:MULTISPECIES: DUF3313 family protein [Chromobacterium]MCP1289283.1 DUF3313 domain-containing protein [Chromobacterium sp. S0633]PTU63855.1 hypothetical protein DB032_02450 [Chromobacterium sp. Panama]UJB32099.1 DUF3313 family protein [Chromobacterium sp. Beijing]
MKPFFKLACALMASALLANIGHAGEPPENLVLLPSEAFHPNPEHAGQVLYLQPGVDLKRYHGILIEPLIFLGRQADGQWLATAADEHNRLDACYRNSLARALCREGLPVAAAPGPGIARLRVAVGDMLRELAGPKERRPVKTALNLARFADDIDPYLAQVSTVGQLEDSESGLLLAGGVNLLGKDMDLANAQPSNAEWLQQRVDLWSSHHARQMAQHLAAATSFGE